MTKSYSSVIAGSKEIVGIYAVAATPILYNKTPLNGDQKQFPQTLHFQKYSDEITTSISVYSIENTPPPSNEEDSRVIPATCTAASGITTITPKEEAPCEIKLADTTTMEKNIRIDVTYGAFRVEVPLTVWQR